MLTSCFALTYSVAFWEYARPSTRLSSQACKNLSWVNEGCGRVSQSLNLRLAVSFDGWRLPEAGLPEGMPYARIHEKRMRTRPKIKEMNDPLEPINRYFFEINYALDETLGKALAGWYYVALPNCAQDGMRNAINNLHSQYVSTISTA